MGIEYTGTVTWKCDACDKEIAETDKAIVVDMKMRDRDTRKMRFWTYVFCNKDCLNTWWKKSTKENLVE